MSDPKLYSPQVAQAFERDPRRTIPAPDGPLVRRLLRRLPPRTPILDVGCGTGRFFLDVEKELRARQLPALGLDRSFAMLAESRRLDRPGLWIQASGHSLPIAGGALGLLLSRFSYHLFPSLDEFLSEARRTLRPGGWLVITHSDLPAMKAWSVSRYWPETRLLVERRFLPLAGLRARLRAAGFAGVKTCRWRKRLRTSFDSYLGAAENRVWSQLQELDEDSCRRGLERLRAHRPRWVDDWMRFFALVAQRRPSHQ